MGRKSLDKKTFPAIIIGGGIVGVAIARDLSLHGIKNLIIDKGDFLSETSQSSSKMLHGGIRYLESYDFSLVREALAEKKLWVKLTPHLAQEKEFFLPVYDNTKYPLFMIKLALLLYDTLSSIKTLHIKFIIDPRPKIF